ncbi:phosphate signaling complex protein PhoU [Fundidesulfovibrio butyratiphilus]
MKRTFMEELGELKTNVITMMRMSQDSLRKAIAVLSRPDRDLAIEVLEGDEKIDSMECFVESEVLRLLALQQPVAKDLRLILGSMRLAPNVERIGDEAVNIADRCVFLLERPLLQKPESLSQLASLARELTEQAVKAYIDLSAEAAQGVLGSMENVVSLHLRVVHDMTDIMVNQPHTVERAVQYSFIGHSLKRVCDQAANISENVVFIAQGVNVKHACGA